MITRSEPYIMSVFPRRSAVFPTILDYGLSIIRRVFYFLRGAVYGQWLSRRCLSWSRSDASRMGKSRDAARRAVYAKHHSLVLPWVHKFAGDTIWDTTCSYLSAKQRYLSCHGIVLHRYRWRNNFECELRFLIYILHDLAETSYWGPCPSGALTAEATTMYPAETRLPV